MTRAFPRSCVCILALLLSMLFAYGQGSIPQVRGTEAIRTIEFAPGRTTALLRGSVQLPHGEGDMHNDGADRYMLSYRAGQTVSFSLESEGQRALFSIVKANYDSLKIPVGTKWSGRLPATGDYYINVFTNTGTAAYTLRVSRRQGAWRKH